MNNDISPPRKNWFARNWPWLVPTGCLTIVLAAVGFVIGILYLITSMIKTSEPYQHALQLASQNELVIAAIGEPIEGSFFVMGSIQIENSNGTADLNASISGPNEKPISTSWAKSTPAFGPTKP